MSATLTIRTAEVTLDLLFERYRTRLVNRNRSPQAIANFTRSVVPFQHWLSERDIRPEALAEDHLYAYFNSSDYPYAPGTRRLHAVQIRAAYRYGHSKGWLSGADPFADFELPAAPEPDPKPLTVEQLRASRRACRNWRHVTLWGLLVYAGMRRNEIRMLSWEDVDLKKDTITVVGKGGKRRVIPIHPDLREILDSAPETGTPQAPPPPFGPKQGAVLWTQARGSATKGRGGHYANGRSFEKLKEAFSPDYGFHRFRKTVATSLADNDVPGDVIDKIMGWAPAGVRARYYVKTKDASLQKAILKLYADDPLGV